MDKEIEKMAQAIKNNPEYTQILNDTMSKQKDKCKNKIKAIFKI